MRIVTWLTNRDVPCFRFGPHHAERLEQARTDHSVRICQDVEEFVQALPEADIALVWRFQQEWFPLAPKLNWIATPAAGRDYFQVSPPRGVRITYGTFHGQIMAETALGMMLASARGLLKTLGTQGLGAWPRADLAGVMRTLRGGHVVILGFGHIGEWVGRLAKPVGVRLTGVRRTPGPPPDYFDQEDRVLPVSDLEVVLPEADHLVLTLPGGPATDTLLNETRLSLLPSHAYIYSMGRGNVIDEAALAEALHQGRIAGACLDVFQTEPLPGDSPLRSAPNILLMPHASAFSPNYMDLFVEEFLGLLSACELKQAGGAEIR